MREINSTSYPVFIGDDVIIQLEKILSNKYSNSKVFILVDENTLEQCLPLIDAESSCLNEAEVIQIESGEENKNIEICTGVWETLTQLDADRKSLLINLGGGVITDMGGFVASCYKRGIDFINIPTTLLSQVDASVGGKTGVDLDNLKNQIGLFSDPKAVFIDPRFLNTLESRQVKSGFAEIIKHALLFDSQYWNEVQKINLREDDLSEVIYKSINYKNNIVLKDKKETGERKSLNFGHTIGHAVETFFMEINKPVFHGEAVAIGIVCESYISTKFSTLKEEELTDIVSFITKEYNLPKLPNGKQKEILKLMHADKKNEQGKINFTLLKNIGEYTIDNYPSKELVLQSLEYYNSLV